MSDGLLIKKSTNITTGSSFNENYWDFTNRKLMYAIYQDGSDRLNKIIVTITASVNVRNQPSSTRSLSAGTALNAAVDIFDKATTESDAHRIGGKTFSLPKSSTSFEAHESKTITDEYSIILNREDYDKIYVTVSTPSGAGNSALNNVSNFQINLPGLKELVTNSDRRVTFTFGGTTYDILNMY